MAWAGVSLVVSSVSLVAVIFVSGDSVAGGGFLGWRFFGLPFFRAVIDVFGTGGAAAVPTASFVGSVGVFVLWCVLVAVLFSLGFCFL